MKNYFIYILLLVSAAFPLKAQQTFRIMWYNVENLFYPENDPRTNDDEFTPEGNRRWSYKRYNHKLQQIAKVINAAGEWDTPALIGLCEVENDSVLLHLLRRTPIRSQHYRYYLAESQDNRGIRVGILYQRDKFRLLHQESIPIQFTDQNSRKTRDILYLSGQVINKDTLDIFLTHFPSRYGGELESESRRLKASRTLKQKVDSLFLCRRNPQILIMGDFNDNPENKSIRKELDAIPIKTTETLQINKINHRQLYNILPISENKLIKGTHKYQGEWNQLDHIIINGKLADPSSSMHLVPGSIKILTSPFLLTEDKTWRGARPKRTYHGFKYEGGYSDHLPLIADFLLYLPD